VLFVVSAIVFALISQRVVHVVSFLA
jgi:hypothetical protein